ncbi:MAG: GGDEF domain-containing protein [Magnetococcales bacterium]|nr:GGDEF domain-containing protein [Magnetococcales bacterium]
MTKSSRALGTKFKKGEVIFQQGESADCMYVVQKGKVEIVMETEFGANRLTIKKKGDVFGEISLFACKSRFASARALKDCVVLKVDERAFITKLHQDPSLAFRTIQSMARRIYDQDHTLMRGFYNQDESCCEITGFSSYIDLALFLDAEVNRARRLMQTMAFAIIDMDGYGDICEKHGIEIGESLLKSLGSILKQHLRHNDIVGRYAEDRFGVLLYEADGMAASKVMEKVKESYSEHVKDTGIVDIVSTFSCGIAIYPEHDKTVNLNKAAFKALTKCKTSGKDQVIVADPGPDWKKKKVVEKTPVEPPTTKQAGWGFGFLKSI